MFGSYNIPFEIETDDISLRIEKLDGIYLYRRDANNENVAKNLMDVEGSLLINPIEPLNRPKKITSYLLIEFERPVILSPGSSTIAYIRFPIEIGVFISGKGKYEILDIISLSKKKFTLYGDPSDGVICKYWKSEIYTTVPEMNSLYEGVIEMNIINETHKWSEITRTVLNAYGMKIYHTSDMVSMKINMRITGQKTAFTEFVNSPLKENMKKSLEIYALGIVRVSSGNYLMEKGL